MANKKFKIMGITVGITFFYTLIFVLFGISISKLLNPFFTNNAGIIAIITGIIILIGLFTGGIALGVLLKKRF